MRDYTLDVNSAAPLKGNISLHDWNVSIAESMISKSHTQCHSQAQSQDTEKIKVIFEKMNKCCNLPKWAVIAVITLLCIAIISGTAVAIVFILSKQAVEVQGRLDKRMVEINGEKLWEEEESNDVNFNGKVEIKRPDQSIKGNLTILHHSATLQAEFDKVKVQEIHETIRIAIQCSTILCGVIGGGVVILCIMSRLEKCKSDQRDIREKPLAQIQGDQVENKNEDELGIMGMTELQRHLLDRRAFGLDMKTNVAMSKEQDEVGSNDAKGSNEVQRCLGCFHYPSTCTDRGLRHLTFTRCKFCIDQAEPCPHHK